MPETLQLHTPAGIDPLFSHISRWMYLRQVWWEFFNSFDFMGFQKLKMGAIPKSVLYRVLVWKHDAKSNKEKAHNKKIRAPFI